MAKTTSSESGKTVPVMAAPALELKYETALAELEQIVHRMEDDHLPLEESIAAYRRGSELLRHCQNLLKEAEQKVQILENGNLRDLDTGNGEIR